MIKSLGRIIVCVNNGDHLDIFCFRRSCSKCFREGFSYTRWPLDHQAHILLSVALRDSFSEDFADPGKVCTNIHVSAGCLATGTVKGCGLDTSVSRLLKNWCKTVARRKRDDRAGGVCDALLDLLNHDRCIQRTCWSRLCLRNIFRLSFLGNTIADQPPGWVLRQRINEKNRF